MTTITLPRATVEQTLEALIKGCNINATEWHQAIYALRAALAQQAEPVKHQHKWFRTGAMEPGQMRCIDCGEWGKEQAEPLNLADPAVQKRLAAQWGYVPAAAQAEPVAWLAPRIVDSYSRPDLGYETCSKSDYGAFPAYTAPPQRTMVPLTDEEIDAEWHELDGEASALFKRVIRKFARAVEKAVWEKNNG